MLAGSLPAGWRCVRRYAHKDSRGPRTCATHPSRPCVQLHLQMMSRQSSSFNGVQQTWLNDEQCQFRAIENGKAILSLHCFNCQRRRDRRDGVAYEGAGPIAGSVQVLEGYTRSIEEIKVTVGLFMVSRP
jgi:hypothetical protein